MPQLPLVVLPIIEMSAEAILTEVQLALLESCDILEWRIDFYQEVTDTSKVQALSTVIYQKVKQANKQLIITFRTQKEGGHFIEAADYYELYAALISAGQMDFLDIEYVQLKRMDQSLVKHAQAAGIKLILSHHLFSGMPEIAFVESLLQEMRHYKGAVYKIALMPKTPAEALALLELQLSFYTRYPDELFVIIGMGELGKITRVAGHLTGSYLTFASRKATSAPGQLSCDETLFILNQLKIN